jgi:hypothetical protein
MRKPVSLGSSTEKKLKKKTDKINRAPHWKRRQQTGAKIADSPYAFVVTTWLLEMLMTRGELNFKEISKRLKHAYGFEVYGETVHAFWENFVVPMVPDERLRATQAAMALAAAKGRTYNAAAAFSTVAGVLEEISRLDEEYNSLMQTPPTPSRAQAVARIATEKSKLFVMLYEHMGMEEWNSRVDILLERVSAIVIPLLQRYVPKDDLKSVLDALRKKFKAIYEEVKFL